jgi:hypothetical protein
MKKARKNKYKPAIPGIFRFNAFMPIIVSQKGTRTTGN